MSISCVLIVSHDKIGHRVYNLECMVHISIIAKLIGVPFITGDFYVIYILANISTHAKLVKRGPNGLH